MTTDAFTEAARAEAERRWSPRESDRLPMDWLDEGMASGFVLGALWARTHLAAQEPTDAEVEAAAEGMWDRYGTRGMWKHAPDHLRRVFRADARAALSAARAARRDEEKR